MITLHIEHPVSDYAVWRAAFDSFADTRRDAGVRAHRISRPLGDEHAIVLALDFDSVDRAESFLGFLNTTVWADPANSPALGGTPRTAILEPAE